MAERVHVEAILERTQPGRPLSEVHDPFQFEVHRAIDISHAELPPLPAYVPREHDRRLQDVVLRAVAGASEIAVLVGGSSTGKTRACWEALDLLRERPEPWRVWHPIDPTRPGAALAEVHDLAPYTVVWLNEAQFYLVPEKVGEQVAAGLRELLREPRRGPVLVLATLWPQEWDKLTTGPDAGQFDPHAQARELLKGHDIKVPDAFTRADLNALADHADQDGRLDEAVKHAEDGQITQYLAGVPVLLARYAQAPPTTRAVIHAAMDARRLGAGPHLPLTLLADAAPGYLTDTQWLQASDDWLQQALDYTATPCNGIPGILTPVKPGAPRNQRHLRTDPQSRRQTASGPLYRLADYLDQHGRSHRADQIPPIDFWKAAAHAHPADLTTLADAAQARGLLRDAAQLFKHAAACGYPIAADALARHLSLLRPANLRPAHWAATHASLDGSGSVADLLEALLDMEAEEQAAVLARRAAARAVLDDQLDVAVLPNTLREAGAEEQVAMLAGRAAAHVAIEWPYPVAELLDKLWNMGAREQVAMLLARNPAAHACLDDPDLVAYLLESLQRVGAEEQVALLAGRAVAHGPLHDTHSVARLLSALWGVWAEEQIAMLLAQSPATRAPLDDPKPVTVLLNVLLDIEAEEQVAMLLARNPAAHASLNDSGSVASLLEALRRAGATDQVAMLLARNPAAHASLDHPYGSVIWLLEALWEAGATEQVTVLAGRAASHDDPFLVAWVLKELRRMGATDQVAMLLARNTAAHASLDHPGSVTSLLDALWEAGATEQVTVLAGRAASHAALDWPAPVAGLLDTLRELGTEEQVAILLTRNPAAHVRLDHPYGARPPSWEVADLLEALRQVGATEQVTVLAERLPAAGRFDEFMGIGDYRERFAFGREPDGIPALPWGWEDLD
ncbi:hypothetical protein OHA25_41040 [Nonomuraea sp. NBC_00507]|uniref:hypothetical protein n=1 Tax=Nonomuraea sp. NBC_00507 TaxID=2976002 RepID=UPI002E185EE8